jgi:putative oxidoreductase
MKKLLSSNYSDGAFNVAMLLVRLAFGLLLIANHGLNKLMNFSSMQNTFYSFMGIGSRFSLLLDLFAELFCSMFIILGLFTRIAAIPLIIVMCVVIFGVHAHQSLQKSEIEILYLTAFLTILFVGPGKISIDGMMRG